MVINVGEFTPVAKIVTVPGEQSYIVPASACNALDSSNMYEPARELFSERAKLHAREYSALIGPVPGNPSAASGRWNIRFHVPPAATARPRVTDGDEARGARLTAEARIGCIIV
jgi:hypothetical protein